MKRPYVFGAILAGVLATNMPADKVGNPDYFMDWAVSLSGHYRAPTRVPAVNLLPQVDIEARYCALTHGLTADCHIAGFYHKGQLFVGRDMPMGEIESTIVHEMIHILQAESGELTSRCKAEFEANHVEWSYKAVVQGSVDPFVFNRSWYNC
jgi:hypothetical protein